MKGNAAGNGMASDGYFYSTQLT